MPFQPEPAYTHGQAARTAILLCNLGTPDAPTAPALRRYLGQFLSDQRVVEIPKPLWWLILHGIILRTRPAQSAAKYASIWTPEGSPLAVWTAKQATLLRGWLGEAGHNVLVRHAMRYGNPSIASQLDALKAEGATRILILPLYPQYSGTTTASVFDAVYAWAARTRSVPELRFVNRYHDDADYIDALAGTVRAHWKHHGPPDKLVMSFHGVPERTLHLGDPYHCESQKTARLLAERLGLQKGDWQLTFQSRFGKAKWLGPYTEPTLIEMGKAGVGRVDVICPGFTGDCLETLEEIDQEARAAFLRAGGKEFHYLPCLNGDPAWIAALSAIARQHLAGWPVQPPGAAAGAEARAHALAGGATA
ncbi:ferrochelatase [Acidovorax sp. SRB_14]|uniref:ferrochelatase n=1 Tax=unclassified Acidovorax TaxID=2684926 RepID=UPI00145E324B|nr:MULTISPECIES: ferrochelatase [unclassified Acidovorax]NMM78621.1 ferrochelatase [Acidovorax sp. SRB_24]NMM82673.1 ferrochelatase [Acidovorax sp. SRB_14]NMM91555.1 ferrochelatase [Rhodococcus sp. SRB_17]